MKVYLASSFALKGRVQAITDELASKGVETTVSWWRRDAKERLAGLGDDDWYADGTVQEIFRTDLAGVDAADALVLVCPEDAPCRFNGANVELGYALAKGKPLFAIGKLERSALYASVTRCADVRDLVRKLGLIRR
jgi:nucleoside 2-deoxyribosyltransferase